MKLLKDMCDENDAVAKSEAAKKAPFQGTGFRLGADLPPQPKPTPSIDDRQIIPPPPQIEVDASKPTTNIQVGLNNICPEMISFWPEFYKF